MSEPFDVPDLIARLRRANTMTLAFEQKEASGCNKYMRYARRKDGKASWVSPFKDVFGDGNLSFITKTGKRGTKKDAIHKKEESRFEHIIRPDRQLDGGLRLSILHRALGRRSIYKTCIYPPPRFARRA